VPFRLASAAGGRYARDAPISAPWQGRRSLL